MSDRTPREIENVSPEPEGRGRDERRPEGHGHLAWATRLVSIFIDSKLTPLVILFAILLGAFAVLSLPREEEPQIKVPMIDVFVELPGAAPAEVEERITRPMEGFLWEIPGVEYIYSTSSAGMSLVIVRFEVGHGEEDAIVSINRKLEAHLDLIPPGASLPLVKPRSIDDVPVLALTFSSTRRDHHELRQVAAEVAAAIKATPGVSETTIIGGRRREVRVALDPARLEAHGIAALDVTSRLGAASARRRSGRVDAKNDEVIVETGRLLRDAEDVREVVVGVFGGRPVRVGDVAVVTDQGDALADYVFFEPGPVYAPRPLGRDEAERDESHAPMQAEASATVVEPGPHPAVTIAVSKRRGTNAIVIVERALSVLESVRGALVPDDIAITVTRNYGETAKEKSDELLLHMGIAVVSVSILIWLFLGWRESGIVAIAIPVTLAVTLFVFYLLGYTLNRITLFALIFSIGILVDDPIVDVENIVRHFRMPANRGRSLLKVTIEAVDEVRSPLILATLAVICAVLPMAFVRGLMGPYMRPIPIGASTAMIVSMLVALVITPWAAYRILRKPAERGALSAHGSGEREGFVTRLYRRVMGRLIRSWPWRAGFLVFMVVLLVGAIAFIPLKLVTVKMLPFDNKSEVQVVIDMPEGTTLESTANVARDLARAVVDEEEVAHVQVYAGTSAPYNFNGLVRHYFLRSGANVADLQVNLAGKHERAIQSHDFAKRIRPELEEIARRHGARIKIAEVPPGPPVIQTLVAEVYHPDEERRNALAKEMRDLFEATEGIVDVDSYVEDPQALEEIVVDEEKAALHGVSVDAVTRTVALALEGTSAGLLHVDTAREDIPIRLRLPRERRATIDDVLAMRVRADGPEGALVPLRELVRIERKVSPQSIYHKNLLPVSYVTGDVYGREESPVYALGKLREAVARSPELGALTEYWIASPYAEPEGAIKWDGEMHITLEVFRDLGLAFAAVLVLIYVLVVGWFKSFTTPLVIMAAIPFSLVGILPAHWLLGAFFTATSMIGFIAGAGIVVRNSIILVDFIELRLREGMPLADAVIDAGAVRFRPMLLTALAVMLGAGVILFDPIFQGLAISLIAGEVAALLLSRMAVPVLYYLRYRRRYERA